MVGFSKGLRSLLATKGIVTISLLDEDIDGDVYKELEQASESGIVKQVGRTGWTVYIMESGRSTIRDVFGSIFRRRGI